MRKIMILFCLCISIVAVQAQERNIITSDSVKLYVNVKGKGQPCLYIHGGPGSGSYWLEKFFGSFLEQHFQMIYLDQRGVGRSSAPKDNNYSMDRMVKDFEEVRESLGIKHWLTMGHSFGGILQMGYVNCRPNAIEGMIFINCTLSMHNSFGTSWLPKAIELAGNDIPPVCLDTSETLYQRMLAIFPILQEKGIMWKIFYADEANEQKMNETYGNFANWNNDFSSKAMEVADYWKDFTRSSAKVKQPVLFFYGKTDWAIGPNHYKEVAFPNMILWGSDVGHMPFMENKEDLEKAVVSFIKKYQF